MVWDLQSVVTGACDSETIGSRFLKTMSTPALAQGNGKSVLQIRIQVFAVLIFLACQLAQPVGVWAVYVDEAQKYDGRMVEAWKDDMDATLVFVSGARGILIFGLCALKLHDLSGRIVLGDRHSLLDRVLQESQARPWRGCRQCPSSHLPTIGCPERPTLCRLYRGTFSS